MRELAYTRRAFLWHEPPHPLAHHRVPTSDGSTRFQSLATDLLALVSEHAVQGRVLLPGAGFLEMARAASHDRALHGVFFLQPLAVDEQPGLRIESIVRDGRFDLRSTHDDAAADATAHCSGALASVSGWARIDGAAVRARASGRTAHLAALYDAYSAAQLQYGPSFRRLERGWTAVHSLARLRARFDLQGTQVHPADVDGALQLGAVMAASSGSVSPTEEPHRGYREWGGWGRGG